MYEDHFSRKISDFEEFLAEGHKKVTPEDVPEAVSVLRLFFRHFG